MISPEWIFKIPSLIREYLLLLSFCLQDSISTSMDLISRLYSLSSVDSVAF